MKKFVFVIFLSFIFSCTETSGFFTTDIKDILENPHDFENKRISIKGQVVESFNFLMKYYKVKDDTGEIYVIPANVVPKKNVIIKVSGYVEQYVKIGDVELTVIRETNQNE